MSLTDDELLSFGANNDNNDADLDSDEEKVSIPLNDKVEEEVNEVNENVLATDSSSTQRARKAQKPRSAVWTHFQRMKKTKVGDGGEEVVEENDSNRCKCNYCGNEYNCNSGINRTSSLWKHLKVCKKKIPTGKGQTELAFGKDKSGEPSLTAWKYDHSAIKRELALLIMEGELPFKFVEHPHFRSLLKLLQPRFIPISCQTCRREVMSLYDGEKGKLKSYLRSSSQGICITTNTWTSNQGMSYMSLTAHFIDEQWKLHKKILNFCPITDHKGNAMGRVIEKLLKDWGIRKLLTCTMDNASANDNLVKYLKNNFSSILGGEFMQMRCVAHIINLIVCEGLKDFNISIGRVREAIKFVRSSSSRTHKFRECVEMEGIKSKNLLCLDVCTRWNSTFFMLESAEKFERAFRRFHDVEPQMRIDLKAKDGVGVPTPNDWTSVRRFLGFLRHFYELTNLVSGTNYVTSSNFFHELNMLYDILYNAENGDDSEISLIASKMIEKCDKYWGAYSGKVNTLLFVTVVLNPRYKLKYVELAIKEMYKGEQGEVIAEMVKGLTYRLFDEYKNTLSPGGSVIQSSNVPSSGVQSDTLTSRQKSRAKFKRLHTQVGGGANLTDLDKYLTEAIEEGDEDYDILGWWSIYSARFPILSMMARDLLSIPISTVASESAFSTGGRVLNPFRSSLTPKIAEALICGTDWIRPSSSTLMTMNEEEELEEQEIFENEISKCKKA